MSLGDFILDGGLFGLLRGFDHEEEGHPYGFVELNEDIQNMGGFDDLLPWK